MAVGIEMLNVFGGSAYLDVMELAKHRSLDAQRFDNLLMKEKTVALPYEDTITFAVNAAKPILNVLSEIEKNRIELLITCTESGIDFGKSASTYIHHYLNLNRNCRIFEIKQACYSGTAGLHMAINFILSRTSVGAKALVIASDISRFTVTGTNSEKTDDSRFSEPSSGAGAVALLVGEQPNVLQIDVGASGYYGYEVMDTCRPNAEIEAGDPDLSLMSYLDCCEQAYVEYQKRVEDTDYRDSFQYLSFHTPFGGMVKGAHRNMMRKNLKANPTEIGKDFQERVVPGLNYCQRVGNIMGATVFLSLASSIDYGSYDVPKRIGIFSYGSGCCSEFYSGIVTKKGQNIQQQFDVDQNLNDRYQLSMDEYEEILVNSENIIFGTRNADLNNQLIPEISKSNQDKQRLVLDKINEFHREYVWAA